MPDPVPGPAERSRTMSSAAYEAAVAVAKEHIEAGDVFQVVLSQRFDLTLDAEPFEVYRVLRLLNPSPYLYFLRFPEVTVVGSSPEPMVRLRDGVVVSRPIAGSRPRGVDRRRRTGGWPASCRRTRRRWPSTSCSSTWPATTSAGW